MVLNEGKFNFEFVRIITRMGGNGKGFKQTWHTVMLRQFLKRFEIKLNGNIFQ